MELLDYAMLIQPTGLLANRYEKFRQMATLVDV